MFPRISFKTHNTSYNNKKKEKYETTLTILPPLNKKIEYNIYEHNHYEWKNISNELSKDIKLYNQKYNQINENKVEITKTEVKHSLSYEEKKLKKKLRQKIRNQLIKYKHNNNLLYDFFKLN